MYNNNNNRIYNIYFYVYGALCAIKCVNNNCFVWSLDKNLNAFRPSEYIPVRGENVRMVS